MADEVIHNGFVPNYNWTGSPAEFEAENTLTGGDSCE